MLLTLAEDAHCPILIISRFYPSDLSETASFSRTIVTRRLELEPEWQELIPKVERVLERLSALWSEQRPRVEKYGKEAPMEQAFIQPVLEALGWKIYYPPFAIQNLCYQT